MIEGLTSLREIWDEAYASIEFSKPDNEFVERLERFLDGPYEQMLLESRSKFSVSIAMQLILLKSDENTVNRLLAAMNRNRERILAELLRTDTDASLVPAAPVVWLAAASTMRIAAAPDRALLALAARTVVDRLTALGKRKNLHVAALQRLQIAGYAALLAGDLDLLRQVLDVRRTVAIFPRQWSLLQQIANTSKPDLVGGVNFLRCADVDVHRQFMAMFQLHRYPTNRHVKAEMGEEGLLAGGQLGGYVYTWIYLQTFAPKPTLHSDWPTLRELLIG